VRGVSERRSLPSSTSASMYAGKKKYKKREKKEEKYRKELAAALAESSSTSARKEAKASPLVQVKQVRAAHGPALLGLTKPLYRGLASTSNASKVQRFSKCK
jgi:hypothetical protein